MSNEYHRFRDGPAENISALIRQDNMYNSPVARITGLSPDTTYYFRAKAECDSYITYGRELSFTTKPVINVITLPAEGIGVRDATLRGMTTGPFTIPATRVSFGWDTTSHAGDAAGYSNWTNPIIQRQPGYFKTRISGLMPNTTYYFRARAEGDTTTYGEELTFTTEPRRPWWQWWKWW